MKEKRLVCSGRALTEGNKLKYITYLVLKVMHAGLTSSLLTVMKFCLWRKRQLAFAAGKTKKKQQQQQRSSGKAPHLTMIPMWLSLKFSNIRHCQFVTFWFEAIFFMHFIRFHFRLSPFFASVVVLRSVAERIVLFTVKVKVHLWFFCFFRFPIFFFT